MADRFSEWKRLDVDNRSHGPEYQSYTEMCMSCLEDSYVVHWCPANSLKAQIEREALEKKVDDIGSQLNR